MKSLFTTILLLAFLAANAQHITTVGVSKKYSRTLLQLVEQKGQIHQLTYASITSDVLQTTDVLLLFNLEQTWDQQPLLSDQNVKAILDFVQAGGKLYLSARHGYAPLLQQLGAQTSGKDGGSQGLQWEINNTSISNLQAHPITKDINKIAVDVCAPITLSETWQVLGQNAAEQPLLAIRQYGKGEIVLGAGARSYRDNKPTTNLYETAISEADNYTFFQNLLDHLTTFQAPTSTTAASAPTTEAFQLFPNPSNHTITLQGTSAIQKIEIYNTAGQCVRQQDFPNAPLQHTFNVQALPKGIYHLRIHVANKVHTQAFVKKEP